MKSRTKGVKSAILACTGAFFIAALSLAACSGGQASSSASGEVSGPWTPDADCESCHTLEANSATDPDCWYAAMTAEAECTTCHADTDTLTQVHADYETGTPPAELKYTSVSADACKGCHDTEELKEKTADCTIFTDVNGVVVNPHDLESNEYHDTYVNCVTCHADGMHVATPIEETGPEACAGACHHADWYSCGVECHGN